MTRSIHLLVTLCLTGCAPDAPRRGSLCTRAAAEVECTTAARPSLPSSSVEGHSVWLDGEVTATASVAAFACAIALGRVHCWGLGEHCALGDGRGGGPRGPVHVAGVEDAIDVAATRTGACALDRRGRVTCWGELGPDPRCARPEVADLPRATAIAATHAETCAIVDTGVVCWGRRRSGPTPIPDTRGATQLQADPFQVCAIWPYGRIRCFAPDGREGR